MRQYEVTMHDGSKTVIHASNIKQAKDRVYLMGDKVKEVQALYNKGGRGKKVRV